MAMLKYRRSTIAQKYLKQTLLKINNCYHKSLQTDLQAAHRNTIKPILLRIDGKILIDAVVYHANMQFSK